MHLFRTLRHVIGKFMPYIEFILLSLLVFLSTEGYGGGLLFMVVFAVCRHQFGLPVYIAAWYIVPLIVWVDNVNLVISGLIISILAGSFRWGIAYVAKYFQ